MFRSFLLAVGILALLFLGFYLFRVKEYTTFEQALMNPASVEWMNLSGKELKEIPEDLLKLPELEIVWFHDNPDLNLNSMCKVLPDIPKLRALVLSKTNLKTLPSCFVRLQKISVLDLSENPGMNLEQIFSILAYIPELTVISLTANELNSLPDNVIQLRGLKKIFLMGNDFTPEEEARLIKLLPECNLEFRE